MAAEHRRSPAGLQHLSAFIEAVSRRQEHRTGNPKGYPTTRKCRVFGHPYLMFLYVVSWLQLVDGVPPERALASTP
jgi:hypothetical protein